MTQDITHRLAQWAECDLRAEDVALAAKHEIERLRAGGCARDQGTTQFCAEAAILAAKVGKLEAENFSLAAWQCEFTDGKTGLVAAEGGGTYCAMARENARLRAALEWIAETTLAEPGLMIRKARAALAGSPVAAEEDGK